jgi:hypothetical protein
MKILIEETLEVPSEVDVEAVAEAKVEVEQEAVGKPMMANRLVEIIVRIGLSRGLTEKV